MLTLHETYSPSDVNSTLKNIITHCVKIVRENSKKLEGEVDWVMVNFYSPSFEMKAYLSNIKDDIVTILSKEFCYKKILSKNTSSFPLVGEDFTFNFTAVSKQPIKKICMS